MREWWNGLDWIWLRLFGKFVVGYVLLAVVIVYLGRGQAESRFEHIRNITAQCDMENKRTLYSYDLVDYICV